MAQHLMYHIVTNASMEAAEYIFEFESRTFRLVRGTEKELDKLTTIVGDSEAENLRADESATKLCDYLSWEWETGMQLLWGGGAGCKDGQKLEDTLINHFHSRDLRGLLVKPQYLPQVGSKEGQIALGLMNEARYANSPFLSFTNYWKILELFLPGFPRKRTPERRAIAWVNQVYKGKIYVSDDLQTSLTKSGLTLGQYLYSECRNAVAHITRKGALIPSRVADVNRIEQASRVTGDLAKLYMQTCLRVGWHSIPLDGLKAKKRTLALKLLRYESKLKRTTV